MAEFSRLDELLDQLSHIYKLTTELKTKEESVCGDARKLLKPWPKKKVNSDEESKTEKTSGNGQCQDSKNTIPAPEVILVEKALAKAQRTRSKFPNKILDVAKGIEQNPEKINVIQKHQEENPSTNEVNACNFDSLHNPYQQSSTLSDSSDSVAVISETKLKSLLTSDKRKNHQLSNGRELPHTKSASTAKDGIKFSSAFSTKGKKSYTDSKGYTPAHVSAPFQTRVSTKKVKPGQTKTQMLRANTASKKSSAEANKYEKQSARVKSGNHNIGIGLRNSSYSGNLSKVLNHAKESSQTLPSKQSPKCVVENVPLKPVLNHGGARNNTVEVRHGQVLTGVDNSGVLEHKHDHMYLNINNNANGSQHTETKKEEVQFILQRDGNKLSVSPKLSKLLSNNRRMREKLKCDGITKKTQNGLSAADSFMNKMQNYFAQGFSGDEYAKLLKVKALCDTYQSLSVIFKDICKKPLTDSSHVREVLKGKCGMEHVLLTFTESEEQYQSLCSDFNDSGRLGKRTELSTKKQASRIFCLPRKFIPDSLSISSKIKYQSKAQLMEYTTLFHQLQFLLMQKFVIDEVSRDLLPLLQNLHAKDNPDQRETIEVYRSVYSLLCCNGITFPVMVQDEDCEDTNSDCDEELQDDN